MAVDSLLQRAPEAVSLASPAPRAAERPRFVSLLAPLTTAGLLYLCYFPVSWGWLAWVAFVPLLSLVRRTRRPRYSLVFLGGLTCYVPLLQWFRVADPRMIVAWLFIAVYCALLWPLFLGLLRLLDRRTRLPLVLTAPAVWTALEYFRANAGGGFSWYQLGYTQHRFLHLIQMADVTGVCGVSFLVMAVNALLAEVLLARSWWRALLGARPGAVTRFGLLVRGLTLVGVLLAVLAYGDWRLRQGGGGRGPLLALLQGNVPQQIRTDASGGDADAAETASYSYVTLADLGYAYSPDLMVWPETSLPWTWATSPRDTPVDQLAPDVVACREEAQRFSTRWRGVPLLLGANARVRADGRSTAYNSAFLIGTDGVEADRYDKIHRVPLGEYVPLRESLPFLKKLAPYDFDYSIAEGQHHTRFTLADRGAGSATFGVVICYEDSVPEVVAPYAAAGGSAADFILNISNDGWFDGTAEHDEHLAICRFRAVENRRGVGRAVNMGISAIIDGNGRVLRPERKGTWRVAPPPGKTAPPTELAIWEVPDGAGELPTSEWHLYKKQAGVLLARVPLDGRVSLYPVVGDWVAGVSWLVLLVGCGLARFRPRPEEVA